jgi:adenine-specific DNA-methyltransferase
MADSQTKLKDLLRELFQLDSADLDFGIYRIMNTKRSEIEHFLDNDLLPQIKEAFRQYQSSDSVQIKADLDRAVQESENLGFDPDASPKVKDLRARLSSAVDISALESQIFSDLYSFFRRYYQEGDFLSLRRYKEGVYAIPYEGEEVKLHWANNDQYYVKSSEYLRDYSFRVEGDRRVHFRLVAADANRDNNKAPNGNDRRFILDETEPVKIENSDLIIRFEYRHDSEKRKQDVLNAQAVTTVLSSPKAAAWISALAAPVPSPSDPNRCIFSKHLSDYTARNSFDYFIHKEARAFLRRELDFYIKNEVMNLDDVQSAVAPKVEQYLSRIRVLRNIAHKIIDFIAQLEEFQKKLWLKKKFVVATNYCVTLDRVPVDLYPEIVDNDAQRKEWVRLFAIDRIDPDVLGNPGYSEPLTIDFLRVNQSLAIDTVFFPPEFKDVLLSGITDLDETTDAVLIHGDNLQAMNLLRDRYTRQVRCIFIDPPYNTGNDEFIYRDSYQHSCWLSMLFDRLAVSRTLLTEDGSLWCTLDSAESPRFWLLAEDVFGADNFRGHIAWQHSVQTKGYAGTLAVAHNNVFIFSRSQDFELGVLERTEAHNSSYSNPDNDPKGPWRTGYLVNSLYRPNLIYEVTSPSGKPIPPPSNGWRYSRETMEKRIQTGEIFFSEDESRLIRKIYLGDQEGHVPTSVWLADDSGTSRSGNLELKKLIPDSPITTVKPTELVERIATIAAESTSLVMDFFAGSGTTGHAIINLNRSDGGRRKVILVEAADFFYSVLKPRLLKAAYSPEWKDGIPSKRNSSLSQLLKYIRLESYEDTLNNLELHRTETQQSLLEANGSVYEEYMLRYMLDVESKASAPLLNLQEFKDPFGYLLRIATTSVGETVPLRVDLVETFNYLLGLRVKQIDKIRGIATVQGINPRREKVLVIWRNIEETPNSKLDEFFQKQGYNTKDMEFDLIYVNGDNNLENLKKDEDTWKVRLIEEEFKRLMFDMCEA